MSKWLTQKCFFNYFKFMGILFFSTPSFAVGNEKVATPLESVLPMLTGLGAILIIIFVLAFLFKKFSNFGLSGKNIKVLETQLIGNNEKLMIVEVREQQFLLGVTRHSINQLGELEKFNTKLSANDPSSTQVTEMYSNKASESSEIDHLKNIPFANILTNLIKPKVNLEEQTNLKAESVK